MAIWNKVLAAFALMIGLSLLATASTAKSQAPCIYQP